MSNPKTNGIHHVAIKAKGYDAFQKMMHFYTELLGMPVVRTWGQGDESAAMLDTGDGAMMEVFANAPDELGMGALRHIAFACEDVDAMIARVREAGYTVTMEPKDIVIPSEPPYPARIAFCTGPVGEDVEFFCVK